MERLDLAPLTQRARGERWRRFRTEARTGEHGPDLTARHWWTRWAYPIAWVLWLLLLPVIPVAVMTQGDTGTGSMLLSLLAPVTLCIAGLMVLGWSRAEFWSIRARRRYRMTEFAQANGLGYEPVATPRRPKAHIFTVPPHRVHSDRFSTPRFVVGNYEEIWDDGQSETEAYQHSYAVFQLRESYPRTLVAHTLTERITWLKNIEPVPGPDRRKLWSTEPEYPLLQRLLACGVVEQLPAVKAREIEIVGNELFVLRGGHLRLDRPQLWQGLEAMAEALAPFLAPAAVPNERNEVASPVRRGSRRSGRSRFSADLAL